VNLYVYVGNNGVNFVDPSGLWSKPIVTINVIWWILKDFLWVQKANAPSEFDWDKYNENYWTYWDEIILTAW